MLKLKTKVSFLDIVVLWLIYSLGLLGTRRGLLVGLAAARTHLQTYRSTIRSHFLQVT